MKTVFSDYPHSKAWTKINLFRPSSSPRAERLRSNLKQEFKSVVLKNYELEYPIKSELIAVLRQLLTINFPTRKKQNESLFKNIVPLEKKNYQL